MASRFWSRVWVGGLLIVAGSPPVWVATAHAVAAPADVAALRGVAGGRLVDTRPGGSTVDGQNAGGGALVAGVVRRFDVLGRAGANAAGGAVALNATVVKPGAAGSLRLWPCNRPQPATVVEYFSVGSAVAAQAVVDLGGGQLCAASSVNSHLIIDLVDQFDAATTFTASQKRLINTSTGFGGTRLRGGTLHELRLKVKGEHFFSVTAFGAARAGFLSVSSCASEFPPTSSSVNFAISSRVTNMVFAQADDLCVWASTGVDIIVDDFGGFSSTEDSASGGHLIGGGRIQLPHANGIDYTDRLALTPGVPLEVPVSGPAGGPWIDVVAWNLTAVRSTAVGHVVAWPCDQPKPRTSTMNLAVGLTRAHLTFIPVGAAGKVCVESTVATTLIVDGAGGFNSATTALRAVHADCFAWRPVDTSFTWAGNFGFALDGGQRPYIVAMSAPALPAAAAVSSDVHYGLDGIAGPSLTWVSISVPPNTPQVATAFTFTITDAAAQTLTISGTFTPGTIGLPLTC